MTLCCENDAQKAGYKNPVFVDVEILEYDDCDVKAYARFHFDAPMKSCGVPLRSLPKIPVFPVSKCTTVLNARGAQLAP